MNDSLSKVPITVEGWIIFMFKKLFINKTPADFSCSNKLLATLGLRQANPLRYCTALVRASVRRPCPPHLCVCVLMLCFCAYPPCSAGVSVRLPADSIRLTPTPAAFSVKPLAGLGGALTFCAFQCGGLYGSAVTPYPPSPLCRLPCPSFRLCGYPNRFCFDVNVQYGSPSLRSTEPGCNNPCLLLPPSLGAP